MGTLCRIIWEGIHSVDSKYNMFIESHSALANRETKVLIPHIGVQAIIWDKRFFLPYWGKIRNAGLFMLGEAY